ncbi:LURP-one-related/scramblase family protein [Clostridium tepidiprofundi]|uniref:LURP-one-related/scramblase family protein n=1 Tax=Clostridium tepidiprofundi TaxID=420412 RepID=UPI00082AC0BF|nr:LURP-one-related family protein [Clostridium tepidiprofundi]
MRYQIREKIFSFGDDFTIKDEFGNDVFIVKGKVFSLGDKLGIYDMNGSEVVYIEQKLFKFLPEYNIYLYDEHAARVKKEFTFFRPRFNIESNMGDYVIEGDVFSLNFEILKNGVPIAIVSKKFFSFSDTYGVDISDNENHAFILALVIVIDQVLHDSNNNR